MITFQIKEKTAFFLLFDVHLEKPVCLYRNCKCYVIYSGVSAGEEGGLYPGASAGEVGRWGFYPGAYAGEDGVYIQGRLQGKKSSYAEKMLAIIKCPKMIKYTFLKCP